MEITRYYLTENRCYKAGKRMTPKGIVVHSTGANNPNLCRYIGPDDGVIGPNKYGNHWNQASSSKCVHAMIGKDKNGVVRCYQTLPWDYRPWGCGSGSKGSYNNTHIQFEMLEDDLTDAAYFAKAYDLAVSLCAYLCKAYGIPTGAIVSHKEAHDAGYASNHGDPHTWFTRQGKTMAAFRAAVSQKLDGSQPTEPLYTRQVNTPGDTLNVRDEANAKGAKLGELKDRSLVEVYGLAGNGWVLIQQSSLRGWVNGKYLVDYTSKPELTRILKLKSPNMRGEDVRWAQARLNALGYNCGTPDGIFGPNTDKAVKAFQRANGLSQDGDIGPKTWAKL